ncbi:MAG: hypothetical protein JSV71_04375 [Nitrospiraceae bacterium]|nr:MAG: hypothetical protein JSV71_04375 [Nitrospiraceae bacterium]
MKEKILRVYVCLTIISHATMAIPALQMTYVLAGSAGAKETPFLKIPHAGSAISVSAGTPRGNVYLTTSNPAMTVIPALLMICVLGESAGARETQAP